MPLYCCRWPNGDLSLVPAKNKKDALYWLDEVDSPQECELFVVNGTCAVHFALQDDGELKFESFSETFHSVKTQAYPYLAKAIDDLHDNEDERVVEEELTPPNEATIAHATREAVKVERRRPLKGHGLDMLRDVHGLGDAAEE